MSQGTFSDTLIRSEAFKRIFVFRSKIDFFQGVSPSFLAKNDQIFKSAFFHLFMSLGIWASLKSPLGIILKWK